MTRLEQKKKIAISAVSRMVKKMIGKSLGRSRKCTNGSQASGETTSLLKDLKNHRNWILNFFCWETFYRWSCLQQIEWSCRNVWEWCFSPPQSVNNQAPNLNQGARSRSIKKGEDASGLAWTRLRANLCCLQKNVENEISSIIQEIR